MHAREKAIKEERTNHAAKENLMGANGKLGMIARWLGEPIVRQGSGLFDQRFLDDPYETPDEMPTADDDYLFKMGYVFDGLSRGMHIEVRYLESDNKLTVDFKGYRVYTEVAGDLLSYASFPEWEDLINRLYKQSQEKQRKTKLANEAADILELKKEQMSFLQKLRLRWGI